MSAIVVRRMDPAAYAGQRRAFADLAQRAAEPNPHMAPAAIAAARLLTASSRIVVLTAWLSEALGSERLVGVWAFGRLWSPRTGLREILVAPILPLFEVLSLPVLERDLAAEVALAFLRHIAAAPDLPNVVALPLLPLAGPTHAALVAGLGPVGGRLHAYALWERPVFVPQPGDRLDACLRRAFGQNARKRIQQYRKLGKAGQPGFRRLRGRAALGAFERFTALEAAGWKGVAGTAIACDARRLAYFRALAEAFAQDDALQIDALLLDGEPIAMGLLIESAGTRHFLKIAYDERHARLSPGRNLAIAMLQADLAAAVPALLDSGAGDRVDASTYPWAERRPMGEMLLTLNGDRAWRSRAAFRLRHELRRRRDG